MALRLEQRANRIASAPNFKSKVTESTQVLTKLRKTDVRCYLLHQESFPQVDPGYSIHLEPPDCIPQHRATLTSTLVRPMSYIKAAVRPVRRLILCQKLPAQCIGGPHHATYLHEFRRHSSNDVTPPSNREWSKSANPARLFETVMGRRPVTDHSRRRSRYTIDPPLVTDPLGLPDDLSKAWRFQLEACARSADVSGAAAVLADISAHSGQPSVHAISLAVDAATAAGDLNQAEQFIGKMSSSLPAEKRSEKDGQHDVLRYSKTKVAMTHAQDGNYEDALRVMGLTSILSLASEHSNRHTLVAAITTAVDGVKADLARSAGAWGVVVRALCGLGLSHAAVAVADNAVKLNVLMTDGFLLVTLDALRMTGRWRDAAWLFETSIQKGLKPSERTISSALRALTCPNARRIVDVERVERIAALAENASQSMVSNSIVAFSAVGAVANVEQIFRQFATQYGCAPSKLCFNARMAAYANFIELIDDTTIDEVRKEGVYEEINAKAVNCWHEFLRAYQVVETKPNEFGECDDREKMAGPFSKSSKDTMENSNVLKNYLRTKVRCFKIDEALAVLEDIVNEKVLVSNFTIGSTHIATVLGAVELRSDVDMLERVLKVMSKSGVRHDIRSVAFTVGTFLGDGDLERALRTVRVEGHTVVAETESVLRTYLSRSSPVRLPSTASDAGRHGGYDGTEKALQTSLKHASYRNYFPALFLRRLSSLAAAFADVGVENVPDLKVLMRRLDSWPRAESTSGS